MGSVPNHFAATATDVEHAARIALAAEAALRAAWQQVCQVVWNRFVAPAETCGKETRGIWERQVSGFWEIIWVAGENASELLARRKLWRTHWPPDEPGDKCSVMPMYQELSGYVRARAREAQDAFWAEVRRATGDLDIQEGERLCAIALVKRLYARCAEEGIGWRLDTSAWPSTVDVAALPWVRRVLGSPESNAAARAYAGLVINCAPSDVIETARHFSVLMAGRFRPAEWRLLASDFPGQLSRDSASRRVTQGEAAGCFQGDCRVQRRGRQVRFRVPAALLRDSSRRR